MSIDINEQTIEEIQERLEGMKTDLNKIVYLESALKKGFSFKIKHFLWENLVGLYEERKMYDKAAKAMSAKSGVEVAFRDKIESYLKAAELYAKAGRIIDADEMFIRAIRNANIEQKQKIKLARKNIFLVSAKELEQAGKKVAASRFYEKLLEMKLDEMEKELIKDKLLKTYKALGKFREARLLEGI